MLLWSTNLKKATFNNASMINKLQEGNIYQCFYGQQTKRRQECVCIEYVCIECVYIECVYIECVYTLSVYILSLYILSVYILSAYILSVYI